VRRESLLVVLGVYVLLLRLVRVALVSESPSSSLFPSSCLAPQSQEPLLELCEHRLRDVPVFLLPSPFFSFLDALFHDFYSLPIPFELRGVHFVLA